MVVAGTGAWHVEGEEVPVRVGSFVRFDPETVRCPHAGPDGLTFVSIGGVREATSRAGPF